MSDLFINAIFLPRQGRDKHRDTALWTVGSTANCIIIAQILRYILHAACLRRHELLEASGDGKEETPFLRCHFVYQNDQFTKTGSGQT